MDAGSLRLGALEAQYCLLFQDLLTSGPIGDAERLRLDRAAASLGLDQERVLRLEAALGEGVVEEVGRGPRDTLVDIEDPSAFSRSSGHIAISVEGGRAQAVSVTFEPPPETDEIQTLRVASDQARTRQEQELLHARYDRCERAGQLDAQWCTAAVLVRRGVATPEEGQFYEVHHSPSPPRPRTALTLDAWELLFHPAQDRTTSRIFELIAPAALLCRVAAMRADGSLPRLDPKQRHDPTVSTVSAVRAIAWAAVTLGLATPPIYVAPGLDGGLEMLTLIPPASRIGSRMLSGQSAVHLAFHAARHVTWFRGDQFVCTLVPTLPDLGDLFIAALCIGSPEVGMRQEPASRSRLIAEAIAPLLEPPVLARLRELTDELMAEGGRIDLQSWAQASGYTASRAGVLLCGDLEVACEIAAEEPNAEDRVHDLERFFAGDAMTQLRSRMGVALGGVTSRSG